MRWSLASDGLTFEIILYNDLERTKEATQRFDDYIKVLSARSTLQRPRKQGKIASGLSSTWFFGPNDWERGLNARDSGWRHFIRQSPIPHPPSPTEDLRRFEGRDRVLPWPLKSSSFTHLLLLFFNLLQCKKWMTFCKSHWPHCLSRKI